jgi:TFIIF-interacting CTD phosphatase-like protein
MTDTSTLPCLVLDIDNTLISISNTKVKDAPKFKCTNDKGEEKKYWITFRPYFYPFLKWCFKHFKVGVWSSGTKDYLDQIIKYFPTDPSFILSRTDCKHKGLYSYKHLKKIPKLSGCELNIMLDDSPGIIVRHRKVCYLHITKFIHTNLEAANDRELRNIRRSLKLLIR